MVLKYHISKSAFTEDFIVRIWEAESDTIGAQVYETTLVEKNSLGVPTPGAGHQVIETLIVNGLDKIVHIVRMYGAVSGNLYHEYNVEPTSDIVTIFTPIQFKIGDGNPDTPAVDQSICVTPELAGLLKTEFLIHRNNYGFLFPDLHFTFNTGDGQWDLLGGDQFGANEEFTITRQPQVLTNVVNDSVVGKLFAGFVDVAANTSYEFAHLRKLIRFSGSPEYEFTISPPQNYLFAFQHFGAAGTAKIKFTNGTLLWAGTPKTEINIEQYTEGAFIWDGTNWNVMYMTQSTFVNTASATLPGTVLGVGYTNVGDVVPGDPVYNIQHNLNITGDYIIQFSLKSNDPALYHRNNKVGSTWWHDANSTIKKDRCYISLQELAGETQNLSIAWVIFKA